MVQLEILSGKTAGSSKAARRFPFMIGRDSDCQLRLDDDGVWQRHATILMKRGEGFSVRAEKDCLVTVNDQPVSVQLLRNGDVLTLGAARLRFWLSQPPQKGLLFPEMLVWAMIAIVFAAQTVIIYWLW